VTRRAHRRGDHCSVESNLERLFDNQFFGTPTLVDTPAVAEAPGKNAL
jgi:hypothetical protein